MRVLPVDEHSRIGIGLATQGGMRSSSRGFRVRDVASIGLEAVPLLVGDDPLPLSPEEIVIVAHVDALRSIDEIARHSGAPIEDVRALLLELSWAGSVVFEEITEVDEIDIISEVEDAPEPEAIPLTRFRASGSKLIQAVLDALERLAG